MYLHWYVISTDNGIEAPYHLFQSAVSFEVINWHLNGIGNKMLETNFHL